MSSSMLGVEDLVAGNEMNIRIEVENEATSNNGNGHGDVMDVEMTATALPVSVDDVDTSVVVIPPVIESVPVTSVSLDVGGGMEDGECSAGGDGDDDDSDDIDNDMEVDNGMLADDDSSPMSRNVASPGMPGERRNRHDKFQSRFPTTDKDYAGGAAEKRRQYVNQKSGSKSSGEQGDLVPLERFGPRQYPNPYLTDEGKKRAERAKRFQGAANPFVFAPSAEFGFDGNSPTNEQLLQLYQSCGLVTDDWGEPSFDKVDPKFRLDSILIRGINKMSTDEIFTYLFNLGLVPTAMEWVNDACCIVTYNDRYDAAASLLKVTKPISVDLEGLERKKNLEIEEKPMIDPDLDSGAISEDEVDKKNGSQEEPKNGASKKDKEPFDFDTIRIVSHDEVQVPMPLGYVWRYARPCDKAKILMRFATTQDRKQERAERHSEYYKKYGNPNSLRYRAAGDFEDDSTTMGSRVARRKRSFKRARYNPSPEVSSSEEELTNINAAGGAAGTSAAAGGKKFNIWSKLSADWNDEERGRGRTRAGGEEGTSPPSRVRPRANTPIPRVRLGMNEGLGSTEAAATATSSFAAARDNRMYEHGRINRHDYYYGAGGYAQQRRIIDPIRRKRIRDEEDEDEEEFSFGGRLGKRDEDGDNEDLRGLFGRDTGVEGREVFTRDTEDSWTSRLKGPTMRMHADVEESRQKLQATRRRLLQKKSSFTSSSTATAASTGSRFAERRLYADTSTWRDKNDEDVDDADDILEMATPARRSVKDRLGAKPAPSPLLSRNRRSREVDGEREEDELEMDEEEANLQSLLYPDDD